MTASLRKGPIAWMAQHPVAANLLLFVCLVGGLASLQIIKREVFPNIERDVVLVSMSYPGASPEEVEQGIVLAIEEAVRGLDDVYHVESTASEGRASVQVEMLEGGDLQKLAQDVQSEVDRIVTFPEEAEEPEVRVMSHRHGVLNVVVYGDQPNMVLHELAEQIRDQFVQDPDITQVEVDGLPPLEISIEIEQEKLRKYGLTVEEVASRLRSASLELPGGGLKTEGGEVLVRVMERRDYGYEFALTPIITTAGGTEVLLGDIATIHDDFRDTDQRALYNGQPSVILEVYRIGDQTPLQVEAAALRQMELVSQSLPPGVTMEVLDNRADIYRARATLLLRNGALGLVLVLITLSSSCSANTRVSRSATTPTSCTSPASTASTSCRSPPTTGWRIGR